MSINPVKHPAFLVIALSAAVIRFVEPRLASVTDGQRVADGAMAVQAGRGLILATLGGWRTLTADFVWLKANLVWEHEELAPTRAWLDLVVAVDERPEYFWLNGARIIAYDMPVWRQRTQLDAPRAVLDRVREEQAQQALGFLARGLTARGPSAALYVEMANIHWRQQHDLASAADCFRRAAETPGAPFYAGRIYAELLVTLGRKREARDWLRTWLPRLPADQPEARVSVVSARLAELERELGP